ncbi:uncharacterized protein RAG0_16747 [Rhynchosporium agropyri]|uniref:Uncharacterized protein n=2 Tax=Rhynchosporium TaxID=38037 RepID=A0A1E1MML0_RHYSE|nr:uncharacterized protein RAG0_16747 [Rhynchosporium agropyri]CZT49975.1 uncharacterized protein RSE6_10884 [Rhynchosporium secalis]
MSAQQLIYLHPSSLDRQQLEVSPGHGPWIYDIAYCVAN